MAQLEFAPAAVARNLAAAFYRYRGLVPAPRGLAPGGEARALADDDVVGDLEQHGYVRLDARRTAPRGARDWVVILILGANGKYAAHSPDLRHLLGGVEAERAAKDGRLDELMVVADEAFFAKKILMDVLGDLQRRQAPGPDLEGAQPYYTLHPYTMFALVVPEHQAVPPHRVMSAEEVARLLAQQRLARSDLPVILASDPPVVWCGGREGQVVEITRDSATAGEALYWRRIQA